jgi:hypothetical protein
MPASGAAMALARLASSRASLQRSMRFPEKPF